jgi:Cof subfamily protein (haloacid dehalogenase superfamily)
MERYQMDIKLIAFDLDGTILNSEKAISPRTRAALSSAHKQGKHIVPCTGRLELPPCFDDIAGITYFVGNNGSRIVLQETGELVFTSFMKKEQARWLIEQCRTRRCLLYGCFEEGESFFDNKCTSVHDEVMAPLIKRFTEFSKIPMVDLAGLLDAGKIASKFSINFPVLAEQKEAFEALSCRSGIHVSSSDSFNIEVMGEGVNKGEGLRFVAGKLGVGMKNVMAIGDYYNDMEMIEEAGFGVAMENGVDEIKAAADFVTASCDDDGVAIAIEKILGISGG